MESTGNIWPTMSLALQRPAEASQKADATGQSASFAHPSAPHTPLVAPSLALQVAVVRSQKLVAGQSASAQQLSRADERQTPAVLQRPEAQRSMALTVWQTPSPCPYPHAPLGLQTSRMHWLAAVHGVPATAPHVLATGSQPPLAQTACASAVEQIPVCNRSTGSATPSPSVGWQASAVASQY
jgi:hypothetical protein